MSEIDAIKKTLDKHEKRILDLEKSLNSKPISVSIDGEIVVLDLINSGFFDTQKKFGEITNELKIQAKFDKKHNYKDMLEKLTRDGKLKRKIQSHQWVYSKK